MSFLNPGMLITLGLIPILILIHTLKPKTKTVNLNDSEHAEALTLLKDPDLLQRILFDFKRCGVVGEETNKLVGYLGAVSRKLDSPLAIIIQSSSL